MDLTALTIISRRFRSDRARVPRARLGILACRLVVSLGSHLLVSPLAAEPRCRSTDRDDLELLN